MQKLQYMVTSTMGKVERLDVKLPEQDQSFTNTRTLSLPTKLLLSRSKNTSPKMGLCNIASIMIYQEISKTTQRLLRSKLMRITEENPISVSQQIFCLRRIPPKHHPHMARS